MTTSAQYKARYGSDASQVSRQLVPIEVFGRPVSVHTLAVPFFLEWENRVRIYEAKNKIPAYRPRTVECFNWRLKKGGKTLSLHSFAIALDIDPGQNPYLKSGPVKTNIPAYVVRLAREVGIEWGGAWKRPVDAMHFEIDFDAVAPKTSRDYRVVRGTTTAAGITKIKAWCLISLVKLRTAKPTADGKVRFAVHVNARKLDALLRITGKGPKARIAAQNAYIALEA